eukprot:9552086-Alexandrium_andersonii.AAC.1
MDLDAGSDPLGLNGLVQDGQGLVDVQPVEYLRIPVEKALAEVAQVHLGLNGEELLLVLLPRGLGELLAGEREGLHAVEVQVRGVELGAHGNEVVLLEGVVLELGH